MWHGYFPFKVVLLFVTFYLHVSTSQEVWETVYLVQYGTGVNIWDFYNQNGGYQDESHDKGLKNPKTIANDGNYRKSKLKEWEIQNPKKVRLGLHNDGGGLLWHLTFNSTDTTLNPETWFTTQRLLSAEEGSIQEKRNDDLVLIFNATTLSVVRKNGWKWLHVDWIGKTNGPEMAFSSDRARKPADLAGVSYLPNSKRVKTSTYDKYTNQGEEYKICYIATPRYIFGVGLGKITATNFIKFLSFKTTTDESCYANFVPYRNSNCQEEVFRPDYDNGNQQFFPVATTKVRSIGFNYTRMAYGNEIYFFIMGNEFIPAPILTIQWLYNHEELVEEIHQSLIVEKVDTSSYKRQQTSATDNRGSVVVFGLLGLIILLTVILMVIFLDAATLGRHLKMMRYNTHHFRYSIKSYIKRWRWTSTRKSILKNDGVDKPTNNNISKETSAKATVSKNLPPNMDKQSCSRNILSDDSTQRKSIRLSRPNISLTVSSKELLVPDTKTNIVPTFKRGIADPRMQKIGRKIHPSRFTSSPRSTMKIIVKE